MKKNTVVGLKKPFEIAEDPLTELLRTGARRLIAEAVEAELQDFLEQFSEYRNQQGHRQVVRNGHLPERELQTGIGSITVKVPKVRDKSGHGIKFNSALLHLRVFRILCQCHRLRYFQAYLENGWSAVPMSDSSSESGASSVQTL